MFLEVSNLDNWKKIGFLSSVLAFSEYNFFWGGGWGGWVGCLAGEDASFFTTSVYKIVKPKK